ncbi:glycosyltransferase family 2 protein [Mucilaginibacter sp.]|uniref:glycosyltransferase family 2 protein n=1 Tax=Mucilaginibacter sp. TaxID=1882438 RepID=UPI003D0ECB54
MTPFFSIIIPLYNSEGTLNDTIHSILMQDEKDYELVFVDGASTDNTLQIIADLQKSNPEVRIKILSERDNGIYDAMNKGLDLAKGSWFYFMGSDDRLHSPAVLSDIQREINKTDTDLIYGNVYGISSDTRYVYDTLSKVLSTGIHHQSIFYKASLFNEFGKYDLRFKTAADYHFTLKVFLNDSFKKRYLDMDIAAYGESGFSSQNYDHTFYSYQYKMLAQNNGIAKIDEPKRCLDTSVYCCLYMAKDKVNILFAWQNLLYYVTGQNPFTIGFRIKTIARMLMWSLTPVKKA